MEFNVNHLFTTWRLVWIMVFLSSNLLVPSAKKYIYICMLSFFHEVLMGTSQKPLIFSKQQCKFHRDWLRNNRAVSFQRSRQTDQPIVQRDAKTVRDFEKELEGKQLSYSIAASRSYAKVLMQSTLLSTLPPISPISRPLQL